MHISEKVADYPEPGMVVHDTHVRRLWTIVGGGASLAITGDTGQTLPPMLGTVVSCGFRDTLGQ
jgi:2-polyprenyl-6-methoxyphenol hydroxylase-like FAD-dependent oxidoreductase